jgi:protocatechuate 3,4-dioxygenase beta subunit
MPQDAVTRPVSPNEAVIAGVVTDDSGTPLAWAIVTIGGSSPEHPDIAPATDHAGRYRFDGLIPGIYTIIVNAEDYPLQQKQIKAQAGQVTRLDFELKS